MAIMYVNNLTFAKVGQRLRATAKVVDTNGNGLQDAVVTVSIKKPLDETFPITSGWYFNFTTNSQGIITEYAPAGWTLHAGGEYEVKVHWIALPGYTWDWHQGFRAMRYTWQ